MNQNVYATDGEFSLIPLSEKDHKNYNRLRSQITNTPIFYEDPKLEEIIWNSIINGKDVSYSIYNRAGEYCGNVMLQRYKDAIPEIGIDLLEEYRNQGIAAKAICLLMETDCQVNKREYYLLRVSSRNPHSKHVVEKMGAELVGEEEGQFQVFMRKLEKTMSSTDIDEISEKMRAIFDEDDKEEEVVWRYRLLPEMMR